jgi:hypothetical protein
VTFANHPDVFRDTIDRRVYLDFVGGIPVTGSNWAAQLWYGPDPNSLTAIAPPIALFRNVEPGTAGAGTWVGGTRTLNGFTHGQTATLQVKVWDISRYSTFDEATLSPGAIFGASEPFSYTVPPVGTAEGREMVNLRHFALVPEPRVFFLLPVLVMLILWSPTRKIRRQGGAGLREN